MGQDQCQFDRTGIEWADKILEIYQDLKRERPDLNTGRQGDSYSTEGTLQGSVLSHVSGAGQKGCPSRWFRRTSLSYIDGGVTALVCLNCELRDGGNV